MSDAAAATPATDAAPTTAPESAPAVDASPAAEPQAAPSFNDLLPEGVRGHEIFKDLESPDQLSERLQGYIPKPQVPQNAMDYYGGEEGAKKLGGLQPIVQRMAETAHKAGMPKEQFAAIAQNMADQHIESVKAQQKQHKEAVEALTKEWGDQAEAELATANLPLEKFGGDDYAEIDQLLEVAGYSNHPTFIRFFHRIGKTLKDDAIIRGEGGGKGKGTLSLNEWYPNHTE